METEADVKARLQQVVGPPFDEEAWDFLVTEHYVEEVIQGLVEVDQQEAFEQLVRKYKEYRSRKRRYRGVSSQSKPRRRYVIRPSLDSERWKIVSLLLTQEALNNPYAKRFWVEIGQPIDDVEGWIREHRAVSVTEDNGYETLQCPDSSGQLDYIARIPKSGLLYQIKLLAGALASRYGWQEHEAVYFLLKRIPPSSPYRPRIVCYPHPRYGVLDRVVLEIPAWLRVEDVVLLYRKAQEHLKELEAFDNGLATDGAVNSLEDATKNWGENEWAGSYIEIAHGTGAGQIKEIASNTATTITPVTNFTEAPDNTSKYRIYDYSKVRKQGYRELRDKQYRLIQFVIKEREHEHQGKRKMEMWKELRDLWNKRYPDNKYEKKERMHRDYHRAVRTLLEPKEERKGVACLNGYLSSSRG